MRTKIFASLCLVALLSVLTPSFAVVLNPGKSLKQLTWKKPAVTVTYKSLKSTPNPGGNNIEVLNNGNLIVVHPLPKPVVGSSVNAESNYVQWAVDNVNWGGTVRLDMKDLKGAYRVFDFGGRTVIVTNQVIIEGAKIPSIIGDKANKWMPSLGANQPFVIKESGIERTILSDRAVVYNGTIQVKNFNDIDATQDITIRSLRFEKSPLVSIFVFCCKNGYFYDNLITNSVPAINPFIGVMDVNGIAVIGVHGEIGESAIIRNNYIDLFGDLIANDPIVAWEYGGSSATGIQFYGTNGNPDGSDKKNVSIKDNYIKNTPQRGIDIAYMMRTITTIEGNTIKQREYNNITDADGNYLLFREGIMVNYNDYGSQMTIAGNTLEGIIGDGIGIYGEAERWYYYLDAKNILIKNNRINRALAGNSQVWYKIPGGYYFCTGICPQGTSNNITIESNIITGKGVWAFALAGDVHNNYIINAGAQLSGFITIDASDLPPERPDIPAHIYFAGGAHDNSATGASGLIVNNLPENNTGLNPDLAGFCNYTVACGNAGYNSSGPLYYPKTPLKNIPSWTCPSPFEEDCLYCGSLTVPISCSNKALKNNSY